jgi:hypothetical protein
MGYYYRIVHGKAERGGRYDMSSTADRRLRDRCLAGGLRHPES